MARPRSEITIAMLEVFRGQSEPMTWRTVAEELARRGVIGAALAPGEVRLVRDSVWGACRRGELVAVGVVRGLPGRTRPPALYRLRKDGDPMRGTSNAAAERARALAELLDAFGR